MVRAMTMRPVNLHGFTGRISILFHYQTLCPLCSMPQATGIRTIYLYLNHANNSPCLNLHITHLL